MKSTLCSLHKKLAEFRKIKQSFSFYCIFISQFPFIYILQGSFRDGFVSQQFEIIQSKLAN